MLIILWIKVDVNLKISRIARVTDHRDGYRAQVWAGEHHGVRKARVAAQLAAQVTAEVPAAGTAPVAEHLGGLFTMSPDGRFVAGPVPDLPGLWVASGCNGSGFSSSLAIGEALASWITSGTPPPGMTALSPGRFGPLSDDTLLTRGLWQYFADCDPGGWQMSISVARKLQAFKTLLPEMPDFEPHRVALTPEWVSGYNRSHGEPLPSSPLKETEKRGDKWRAAWGIEQTEIDSLLTPGRQRILARLARDAIAPFYDRTLDERVFEARGRWMDEAQAAVQAQTDSGRLEAIRADAARQLDDMRRQIRETTRSVRRRPGRPGLGARVARPVHHQDQAGGLSHGARSGPAFPGRRLTPSMPVARRMLDGGPQQPINTRRLPMSTKRKRNSGDPRKDPFRAYQDAYRCGHCHGRLSNGSEGWGVYHDPGCPVYSGAIDEGPAGRRAALLMSNKLAGYSASARAAKPGYVVPGAPVRRPLVPRQASRKPDHHVRAPAARGQAAVGPDPALCQAHRRVTRQTDEASTETRRTSGRCWAYRLPRTGGIVI